MPTIVPPISAAKEKHDKLDPRLAALVTLDDHVFEPADVEAQEPAGETLRDGREALRGAPVGASRRPAERRSGPLAFLRGPRPNGSEALRGGRNGFEAAQFPR